MLTLSGSLGDGKDEVMVAALFHTHKISVGHKRGWYTFPGVYFPIYRELSNPKFCFEGSFKIKTFIIAFNLPK